MSNLAMEELLNFMGKLCFAEASTQSGDDDEQTKKTGGDRDDAPRETEETKKAVEESDGDEE